MKLDTGLAHMDPGRAADDCARYERCGFDAVWSVEAGRDPFLPLVSGALASTQLQLGTNIAVAFARSPLSMAQVAWDLQRASGGRFILGLGTQVRAHIERRYSMPFEHPAARVTDYIRCVRAIWDTFQTGARPDYRGPFYQFTLMNPMFSSGPIDQPDIPIYLAGVNPRMVRAAGEVADGFAVHPMHSVGHLTDVVKPALAEGAKSAGRDASQIELHAPVFAISGATQAEWDKREQEVRRQISFYGSTPSYRTLLEYHGYGEIGRELSAKARRGEWAEMAKLIPDDLVEAVAVIAKPDELPAALKRRCDGLLDRVMLYFDEPASEEESRAFVEAFRAA